MFLRWTGPNSLLWTAPLHILKQTLMEPPTTWGIPTPLKVIWHWPAHTAGDNWAASNTLCLKISFWHFCTARITLQHHRGASKQNQRWRWDTGGSQSAVLHSGSRQAQTVLLPQLWWVRGFRVLCFDTKTDQNTPCFLTTLLLHVTRPNYINVQNEIYWKK